MDQDFNSRRDFLALSAAVAATAGMPSSAAAEASPGSRHQVVCVLGASGMVGNAIVRELLAADYRVVAVSRDVDKLATIRATYRGAAALETLQGDVSSDELAQQLRSELIAKFGPLRAVVASLSGVYLGINGGLADFAGAGMGQLSITQSALRTLYEVLAQEAGKPPPGGHPAFVRVLGLYGLVDPGPATPDPQGRLISGQAIGQRAKDIIGQPQSFPGPSLAIKARAYS